MFTKNSNIVKWHPLIFLSIPLLFIILGQFNFEIGKEAYFYTLSTVAQSLAALIGLMAVFIIFKFDKLKSQRRDGLIILKKKTSEYFQKKELSEGETPYSSLIKLALIESEEDFFDKMVSKLEEIKVIDEKYWPSEFKNIINELDRIIKPINETNETEKNIRMGLNVPLAFALIAIMVSIIILPFGWIETPFSVDYLHSSSLKMALVGFIIYLAFSINFSNNNSIR